MTHSIIKSSTIFISIIFLLTSCAYNPIKKSCWETGVTVNKDETLNIVGLSSRNNSSIRQDAIASLSEFLYTQIKTESKIIKINNNDIYSLKSKRQITSKSNIKLEANMLPINMEECSIDNKYYQKFVIDLDTVKLMKNKSMKLLKDIEHSISINNNEVKASKKEILVLKLVNKSNEAKIYYENAELLKSVLDTTHTLQNKQFISKSQLNNRINAKPEILNINSSKKKIQTFTDINFYADVVDDQFEMLQYTWKINNEKFFTKQFKYNFKKSGNYILNMNVYDPTNKTTAYKEKTIVVLDQKPKAIFKIKSYIANKYFTNEKIDFINRSNDIDGYITKSIWYINGDIIVLNNLKNFQFNKPAVYDIVLEVYDNNGNKSIKTKSITVKSKHPKTEFYHSNMKSTDVQILSDKIFNKSTPDLIIKKNSSIFTLKGISNYISLKKSYPSSILFYEKYSFVIDKNDRLQCILYNINNRGLEESFKNKKTDVCLKYNNKYENFVKGF